MPKKIDISELNAIKAVVAKYSEGVSIATIAETLDFNIESRTLQRRLNRLFQDGAVRKSGKGRNLQYFPADYRSPTHKRPHDKTSELLLEVSRPSQTIFQKVTQPLQKRKRVGYVRSFLDNYIANETFYLPPDTRTRLEKIGRPDRKKQPAGTYARKILDRLLIDLSFHSSRLEGNTYSLLETKHLIENGKTAQGHDAQETQMIINHKRAIEFLVESADMARIDRRTILNLHAILSDNLLGDPAAGGRIRRGPVEIGSSVYTPLAIPQLIEECFHQIIHTAGTIQNPFEQSFFLLVHLPYLQPFEDVNKRVSRLAANIPLIRHNLRPLSFIDVPKEDYVAGLLGVYELNKIDLLRDVYIWAYERSTEQYTVISGSLGSPDEFRMRYRSEIKFTVAEIVRKRIPAGQLNEFIEKQIGKRIPDMDKPRFIGVVESELVGLHEGNFARYPITPGEFSAWLKSESAAS